MAMPDNELSAEPVPGRFVGARALPVTQWVDYEDGGVGIQDPSEGLQFQIWRTRLLGEDIVVDAPNTPTFTLYSGVDLTEVSLTFDQNMQPVLAFVEGGVAKLRWYDNSANQFVIDEFPGYKNPRVFLDDKRPRQSGNSDVLFFYIKADGTFAHRRQRDLYADEITLDPGPWPGLIKVGFNSQYRVQFLLKEFDE